MTKQTHMSDSEQIQNLNRTIANYQVMNRALEMISVEMDFSTAVNKLLAMIGQALHADRCYIFQFTDNGEYCDNTFEWVVRSEIAEIDNLQHIPVNSCNWHKFLLRGKPVIINDMDQPPEEYDDVADFLRRQHIKSIFLIDLRVGEQLVGFLGVDFVDQYNTFSDSMLQMLKNAVKLYSLVCERSRNLRLIKEKSTEISNRDALLNTVINSLPANVFAKDADHEFRYIMANRHLVDFIGKPLAEIIGKTDRDLFSVADEWTWLEQRDAEIMTSGQSHSYTETIFNASGREVQFQTVKTPCVGPSGEKLLLGISIDNTRNARINKSREIIRQCLETLVLHPNLEEGITRSISQVREYIGADRIYFFSFDFQEQTGKFHKEFCAPNHRPVLVDQKAIPFSTSINWKQYFRDECFMNFPDLQDAAVLEKFGERYAKIIKDLNAQSLYCHRILIQGKLWGYVGIEFDERKRILTADELDFVQSTARFVEIMIQHEHMQSELLQALKAAKASEKAKSYFLASMSHEIRTPLNAVIGFSEILKDGSLPPETQKSYLNDISVAGNALLALINDVLDLSKLEAGQMVFTPTETDFAALVSEVATIFQQRLCDKGLQNNISVAAMPLLLLDKLRMRQILFNLLGNAVKFTEHGHIDFTASFTPDGDVGGTLRFALSDTGCGIAEEEQKRLFQPFIQSNTIRGTQAEKNGTGLGLAIVRKMLERLHGDIQLASEPGKGSTFTVTIHKVAYSVTRHIPRTGKAPEKAAADSFSGSVLIIDDVKMNLKVTQAMLQKLGVNSETANSPDAALKCLEQKDFPLILCDLWMPVMNGDELTRKIRKLYPDRKMKIIVLTADTEANASFDISIFDGMMRKPVSMSELRKALSDSIPQ